MNSELDKKIHTTVATTQAVMARMTWRQMGEIIDSKLQMSIAMGKPNIFGQFDAGNTSQ